MPHVLELPFYGVVGGVAAAAATAPIAGADGEALLERRQDRGPAAVVGGRPVDQHEGRSLAATPVGDGCAVFGGGTLLRHDVLLPNPPSSGRGKPLHRKHDATRPSPLPISENSAMAKFAERLPIFIDVVQAHILDDAQGDRGWLENASPSVMAVEELPLGL